MRYSGLFFNCGFMNGADDVNIFNATSVMVVLQDGECMYTRICRLQGKILFVSVMLHLHGYRNM